MENITIHIVNVTGNRICAESEDGQKVYENIKNVLNDNKKISISFKNVEIVTSAFLNTAIGQLLKDFSRNVLKERVSFIDIDNGDKVLLKRVIDTAELYYKNPKKIEESLRDVLGESSEE